MSHTNSSSAKAAELISLLNEDQVIGKRIFFKYDRNSGACGDMLGGIYSLEEQNENEEGELSNGPYESQIVIFSPLTNNEYIHSLYGKTFYIRLETYTDRKTKYYFEDFLHASILKRFLVKMLDEGHICYDENKTTL